MEEKEINEDSEFKEEIILEIPKKISPPKNINTKLRGKKTILKRKKNPTTDSNPVDNIKIQNKSNAEFLIESIMKTFWVSKWKDQLLTMKYSRQGFNKKRGDFRGFCMKMNKAMKYHQYLYLAKLFDKMESFPKKEDIEHDDYYGKLKFVKNNSIKFDEGSDLIITNNNQKEINNKINCNEIIEIEFNSEDAKEQIKINEKNDNNDNDIVTNNEKIGKLIKKKTIIKKKKDQENLDNKGINNSEENNLNKNEINNIISLDNILTGQKEMQDNHYNDNNKQKDKQEEKKETQINNQIEIKKVEEEHFDKDNDINIIDKDNKNNIIEKLNDNNDNNELIENKKIKNNNFQSEENFEDLKRKTFDFSEINNFKKDNGLSIDEDIDSSIKASVRKGFIRKVYGILSIQLLITFGAVILCQAKPIKYLILHNMALSSNLLIISSSLFIIFFLILACCRGISRRVPYNYLFLLGITLCEAILCSITASLYSFQIVSSALLLTIVSTLAITLYACNTKNNFAVCRIGLYVILSQMLTIGIISVFFRIKALYTFYTFCSTILVGIYLVYDTQLILAKLGTGYSIDDYIFASLEIYMDIIRLFLLILKILGNNSHRN